MTRSHAHTPRTARRCWTDVALFALFHVLVLFPASIQAQTLDQLIARLRSPSVLERSEAAKDLGSIADPRAEQALIRALDDADRLVRNRAAESLGRIGGASSIEPLRKLASDPDDGVRLQAAAAVSRLTRRPEYQFHRLRQDPDPSVRREAAAFFEFYDPRNRAIADTLIAALSDPDAEVRGHVVNALGRRQLPGVADALYRRRTDPDPRVRANVTLALAELGDSRAVDALLGMFASGAQNQSPWGNSTADVRFAVATKFKDQRLVAPLVADLASQRYPPVETARSLRALGALAVPALIGAASTPQPGQFSAQSNAIYVLGTIGDRSATDTLIAIATSNADWTIRSSAVSALGSIKDPRAVPALITVLERYPPSVSNAADRETRSVAASAANALGAIGDSRAIDALVRAHRRFDRFDVNNRDALLNALIAFRDPRIMRALIDVLDGTDTLYRRPNAVAAEALTQYTDPAARQALMRHLRSQDNPVIEGAVTAFIAQGEAGTEQYLLTALEAARSDTKMVRYLLASGNAALVQGARDWIARRRCRGMSGSDLDRCIDREVFNQGIRPPDRPVRWGESP